MSIPTVEQIAGTLAYYECRRTNPKADHPRMGYHAFSENQREHLRAAHAEAAAEIHRMMSAALTAAAPHIQAAALRDAADALEGGWAYGAELKPDGNEDRAIAAAIQMTHENAEQLRARADQLEGKSE